MEAREADIQKLCDSVLSLAPTSTGDYGSGAICPFCGKECSWNADDLASIEHESNCAVLIAKDLKTNVDETTEIK